MSKFGQLFQSKWPFRQRTESIAAWMASRLQQWLLSLFTTHKNDVSDSIILFIGDGKKVLANTELEA